MIGKRQVGFQAGFTLIETVVAMLLFTAAMLVAVGALSVVMRNTERARDRVTMLNLAKSQIELITKSPYQPTGSQYPILDQIPQGYIISVELAAPVSYFYPSSTPTTETVQNISVSVQGYYGSLTVSTYRALK